VCVCVCVCVRICTKLDKRGNQNMEINHRNKIWEAINSRPSLMGRRNDEKKPRNKCI
jgi:hypothetical protein